MQALSQLSYSPGKLVLRRKVYRRYLAVLGRREAKLVLPTGRGNQIDLLCEVLVADIATGRVPAAHQPYGQDVAVEGSRLDWTRSTMRNASVPAT